MHLLSLLPVLVWVLVLVAAGCCWTQWLPFVTSDGALSLFGNYWCWQRLPSVLLVLLVLFAVDATVCAAVCATVGATVGTTAGALRSSFLARSGVRKSMTCSRTSLPQSCAQRSQLDWANNINCKRYFARSA